ncbi:MAG: esterase family protein [Phycisphaerales bacterium]|nr:MAG: esterase family protein [Phycisphaerales bacterium]
MGCRLSAPVCLVVLLSVLGMRPAVAQRRDAPVWPQVGSDRTVTFHLRAPQAQRVLLNANFLPEPGAMTKDAEGLWSITSAPLAPEIYEYDFTVDGLTIPDPANPFVKVWRRRSRSMVLVPGNPPKFFEEQNVSHGTVHVQRYRSRSLDVTRGLYVYTPPGYETARQETYPALYLLHGSGDTEDAWTIVGRANVILDNAIAVGRARPMIVAMPYGHTPGAGRGNRQAFEADLIGDVIPFVEKRYRVRADAADRAIVGLSMGGGQSLRIGLGHPDLFAWVGAFSSSAPSAEELQKLLAQPDELNEKLKLLWVGCGREDFLFERNQQFRRALEAQGIEYIAHITDGGHEWRLWRRYLNEILPLLFRSDR